MKNINEKYAHLQRTSWPQYANTTLGHLPADKYKQIEAAYEAQLATEAGHETPTSSVPTPDVEFPTGDSMNSASGGETPSGDVSEQGSPDAASEAPVVADQVDETPAVASEMADVETGFDDEIKAGE